jgi:hypothetical protein
MAPQRQDGAHAHPCLSLQGPKTDLDFTMQHDMPHPHHESPWRIFIAFLRLGISCFGGPIAHLGYFRAEFVHRRRWLDDHAYGDLVALSQFLPGRPAAR